MAIIEGGLRPEVSNRFGRQVEVNGITVQSVIDLAADNDVIYLKPGSYAEAITIPASLSKLTIVGQGGRGAVFVQPGGNGVALTNHSADLTLVNVGLEGAGTGGGLANTGRRLRAYGCKIEGGALAADMSLGTIAQLAALTRGQGDDALFEDCEFCWATKLLTFKGTDEGAVTQHRYRRCYFHNGDTHYVHEGVGSGGSAAVTFRNVVFEDCVFEGLENGDEPATAYMLLNASNDNTGNVTNCSFPTLLAGGKNLVSTKMLWVANRHLGGISGAQPS